MREGNKYGFQKLTPVSTADISVYEDAINYVFDNDDVKNVAISGAYGAGKSSTLESYKAKHREKSFVHISLAHFRNAELENLASTGAALDETNMEPVRESVLEWKILNQLIHQIPFKKIPQTNFRVKKGGSLRTLIVSTVLLSLFLGVIAFLVFADRIGPFADRLPDNWARAGLLLLASPFALISAVIISAVCIVIFVFSLIKAQRDRNILRKVSLQGNEIAFEEREDSYFDKYLNDVLYLFENVEADVIVFEDLDRFNASRIFERLHEVNTLVNIQRRKTQTGKFTPLRFFYLLRDDIFICKDRTKFFDFIVPIVPVVDGSNSYEQFLKHLEGARLLDRFDLGFLQRLSLYVDDMRILKNIHNEFIVYFNRLNTTDLDYNRMLAMVTYKNLFPRDFCDLQLAKGFVHTLFSQKESLMETEIRYLENEGKGLKERIELAKNEALDTEQEIRDAYAAKMERLRYNYSREDEKKHSLELSQRIQALTDKTSAGQLKLESELAAIEHKIAVKRTEPLKSLITRPNADSVFSVSHTSEIGVVNNFHEIKGSDYFALLKFLIKEGLIDETYADYMTYFYEDSISANDKGFLRRITDRRGSDYAYALREPHKIVASPILREFDFGQEETLNFDLLDFLLQNDSMPKHDSYLRRLMSQIREAEDFHFVSEYYGKGKARMKFVVQINEQWPAFFCTAFKRKALTDAQLRQFSIDTLYYSHRDIIAKVNDDHCLRDYISDQPDYLAIEQPDIQRLIECFNQIEVSFAAIDYDKSNRALFDAVYSCGQYDLTYDNIALMLRVNYKIESTDDIRHKNYTMVRKQNDSPLAREVTSFMPEYVQIVLDSCEGTIADDEEIAIELLNKEERFVSRVAKEQYIDVLSTVITHIAKVDDAALWTAMLRRGIVAFSMKNFVNYFEKHEIDDILVDYLNSDPKDLDFSTTADEFNEETARRLFDELSKCNEIYTDKYREILLDLRYRVDNYDEANEIADDKFAVLINEGILRMDAYSLRYVREKYAKHMLTFIRRNLDEYLSLQITEILSLGETLQILEWDIDDDKKKRLLALTDEPISVIGRRYADTVNAYLIVHNLEVEDKASLYESYPQYGSEAQAAIAHLAAVGVKEIIANNTPVADSLLTALLQTDDVARHQKVMLFVQAIPRLSEDTCKMHFDELELPELKGIFTRGGGRRKYVRTEDVTTILDALKANGWIYDYTEDEGNSDRYFVTKNKPTRKTS